MPIVRCPIHDIPYNSANPRGCPACWRAKQGQSSDAEVMKQLARLSMGLPAIEQLPPESKEPQAPERPGERPRGYRGSWPPPVTTPPRVPVPEPSALQKLWRWAVAHRAVALALAALAVALPLVWMISRAPFVAEPHPPVPTAEARPLPLHPNVPVSTAFAMLGTAPPVVNPDSRALARYLWDDGVTVDALNGMVYAVTMTGIARLWEGLRVGMDEEQARGALTLLGPVSEPNLGAQRSAIPLNGYQVVSSLEERPRRRLVAAIRPPNGCADVVVRLNPRAIGRLRDNGDADTLWALARGTAAFEWVVTRVRVVSRAVPGPYAGGPDCTLPPAAPPAVPGLEFIR